MMTVKAFIYPHQWNSCGVGQSLGPILNVQHSDVRRASRLEYVGGGHRQTLHALPNRCSHRLTAPRVTHNHKYASIRSTYS